MFALDLFNNDHERRLAEGAVDQLEQRRIDDLAMKMDSLVARAKQAKTPAAKQALIKEFQKCKAERDSYYKIKDECMGYGGLGEAGLPDVVDKKAKMAQLNQPVKAGTDVVAPQQRVNPNPNKGVVGHAKDWLTGRGGPGKEGPTYESQKKNSKEVNEEQRLHAGDPVVVTAPNEFEGATGEIYEFSPSGTFVIVNLYNHGKHSMHLSDVEYNEYADDEELDESNMKRMLGDLNDISDADFQTQYGRSKDYWRKRMQTPTAPATDIQDIKSDDLSQARTKPTFDRTGRMVKTRRTPVQQSMKRMLGTPKNVRPTPALEPVSVSLRVPNRQDGYDLLPAKIFNSEAEAREFARRVNATILDIRPVMDENFGRVGNVSSKIQRGTLARHGLLGDVEVIKVANDSAYVKDRTGHESRVGLMSLTPKYDQRRRANMEEGFQDFNKVEPYAVCLSGKPVKKFDYYEDARRFHDNWKKKLYREGDKAKADKITLMPLDLDEEEQKPGFGEFPPKQEITIVPPKKLKSGQTYQDQNKYWQSQGQAPIYKTNEMDKSQTPPGRAGDYPLGVKGTTGKPVTAKRVVKDLTKDLDQAFSKEKKVKEAGSPAQPAIAIAKKKQQGVAENDDWDDGDWDDIPDTHAVVKANQPSRYPESVLRAIERNPAMRADIIADYKRKQGVTEDGSNYQQQLSRAPAPNAVGSRYQKDMFATPQQSLAQQTNLKTGATPPVKWKKLNTTTAQDIGVRVDSQYVPAPNGGITVKGMATSYDNKTQYPYALTIDADHQIRYKSVDKLNDDELDAVFQNLASNGLLDRKYINPLKAQIQEEKNKEKDTVKQHAQDQEYVRKDPILNYGGSIGKVKNAISNAKRKNLTAKNDVEAMFAQIGDESQINQDQENLINQLSQRLDQADAVNQQQSDVIAKLSTSLKPMAPRQPVAQQQQQPVREESTTSTDAVERAILNRIMVAHTDLLMQFGPDKVMQAVEEVAYGVGDVDEIGTSDVSAYVAQVRQILGAE
jgi:hypothetical protein